MATMDTARHPTLLIASRITSRLRSPLTFDVFFGYEIHTKAFGAACFESLWANLVICERRVAKTCTKGYIPPLLEDTVRPVVRQCVVPDTKRISFCLTQALRFGIAS